MVFLFFYQTLPLRDTKTISLFFNEEYFAPEGVIKKPSLYLADIFPDLNAESFLVLSILAYLITSDLKFFIILNIFFNASLEASQIPFSVINPVTYFAGVTSKAKFNALLFLDKLILF